MKKIFLTMIFCLLMSANIANAAAADKPVEKNVRLADIGAEMFLLRLKDNSMYLNIQPSYKIYYGDLDKTPNDKSQKDLRAWTTTFQNTDDSQKPKYLFEDEDLQETDDTQKTEILKGTLTFFIDESGYVVGISLSDYFGDASKISKSVSYNIFHIIGLDEKEINEISKDLQEAKNNASGFVVKCRCSKTDRTIIWTFAPNYVTVFATH